VLILIGWYAFQVLAGGITIATVLPMTTISRFAYDDDQQIGSMRQD
jgi:hypothetical protein